MESSIREYRLSLGTSTAVVSKTAVQKKRADRISVFVDGDFAFGISEAVARRNSLTKGSSLEPAFLSKLDLEEEISTCKRTALNFISYRMRSEVEVRRRLEKDAASEEAIQAVLQELREKGILSDRNFAGAFARDAAFGKKWGPHRIERGLRQAGIASDVAAHALEEIRDTIREEDVVMAVARKRWTQLSSTADAQKRKKKLYDFLRRRGFDYDDIRRALKELTS